MAVELRRHGLNPAPDLANWNSEYSDDSETVISVSTIRFPLRVLTLFVRCLDGYKVFAGDVARYFELGAFIFLYEPAINVAVVLSILRRLFVTRYLFLEVSSAVRKTLTKGPKGSKFD